MANVICGLLFAFFCFSYLAFLECDYLSFVQHFYSYGRNVTHGLTLPIIMTGVLTLFGVVIQHFLHLPIRFRALSWIPSYYLLAITTSFELGRFSNPDHTSGWITYLLFALAFLVTYNICLRISERRNENASLSVFLWPNLLISLIGIVFVAATSNTNERLHTELRIERAIGEERWDEALDQISQLPYNSRILTAYSAYALAQENRLGDSFFAYAHPDGAKAFLPLPSDSLRPWNPVQLYRELLGGFPVTDMNAAVYLEYLSRDTLAKSHVPEFLLTSYLLERDLDGFARKMLEYYPPQDTLTNLYTRADSLPSNFGQALCLYGATSDKPITQLQDSLLTADYKLFDSLSVCNALSEDEKIYLRQRYFGSYWYYYKFIRK